MKKPKFRSSPDGDIINLMRGPCLLGILLLAAGALFNITMEAQAKPVRQGEETVQFRGVPAGYPPGQEKSAYALTDELLVQQLLLSFENNSASGYASVSTSFTISDRDWTAECSFDLEGTYDPETGVVEGTFNMDKKFRYPPFPGFHYNGEDLHYYGTFKSWYEDPAAKFSLADAKVDLFFTGTVARDMYYDNSDTVWHTEDPAGFLINFVREAAGCQRLHCQCLRTGPAGAGGCDLAGSFVHGPGRDGGGHPPGALVH